MAEALVLTILMLLLLVIVVKILSRKKALIIPNLQGKHLVITGGSSGIGLAIAKEALIGGAFVTLISRDHSKLLKAAQEIIAETGCHESMIKLKVADVGDYLAIEEAIKNCWVWRPIDVLVCNAGVTYSSLAEDQPIERIESIVNTNITGTLFTVKAGIPFLKRRSFTNPVSLVLMGSLSSLYPIYGGSAYTCSKYAIKGLAESLRLELLPYSIRVTLVCPGFIDTPLLQNLREEVRGSTFEETARKVSFIDRMEADDPKRIAKVTLKGVQKGDFLVVDGTVGFCLSCICRGTVPSESTACFLCEILTIIPFKLIMRAVMAYVQQVIIRSVNCSEKDNTWQKTG